MLGEYSTTVLHPSHVVQYLIAKLQNLMYLGWAMVYFLAGTQNLIILACSMVYPWAAESHYPGLSWCLNALLFQLIKGISDWATYSDTESVKY